MNFTQNKNEFALEDEFAGILLQIHRHVVYF